MVSITSDAMFGKIYLGEVNTPHTLGMLIKGHGFCVLTDIPQLNDALIV